MSLKVKTLSGSPFFEIIEDLPYEEYAAKPHVSSSLLKLVLTESLATVKATLDGKLEKESEALEFGKAFHSLLEGKEEFVIQPDEYQSEDGPKKWSNNAKVCKAWNAAQKSPVFTKAEVENLRGMAYAVRQNDHLNPYLPGRSEVSVFVDHNGRKLKARYDLLPFAAPAPIIDFKKARSANPEKFVRQIWDMKYYVQAALYLDIAKLAGFPANEFWLVAVEEKFPHNIFIAKLADVPVSLVELGRKEYRAAYQKLEYARRVNRWPSFGSCEAEMHLTAWMLKAIDLIA